MRLERFKNRKPKVFKHRNKLPIKNLFLCFGQCGFFFLKPIRLEFKKLDYIRRRLRKIKKLNKRRYVKRKFIILASKNCPVTRKTKNARMGKGKGKFVRWSLRFHRNHMLVEFKNINYIYVRWIYVFFKKYKYFLYPYFSKYTYYSKIPLCSKKNLTNKY